MSLQQQRQVIQSVALSHTDIRWDVGMAWRIYDRQFSDVEQ
jgi:hypothetical protein